MECAIYTHRLATPWFASPGFFLAYSDQHTYTELHIGSSEKPAGRQERRAKASKASQAPPTYSTIYLTIASQQRNRSSRMVVAAPSSSSSASIGSELGSLFAAFDADADGRISASELRECMRATLGAEAAVSAEEAVALVADADADGDGLLDAAEFARLVARLHQDAGEEDRHRGLRQAFQMYSENNTDGCIITPASLRRMLARLGEHQDVDECRAMICRFDLDGDGVLSFDEFKIMMNAA